MQQKHRAKYCLFRGGLQNNPTILCPTNGAAASFPSLSPSHPILTSSSFSSEKPESIDLQIHRLITLAQLPHHFQTAPGHVLSVRPYRLTGPTWIVKRFFGEENPPFLPTITTKTKQKKLDTFGPPCIKILRLMARKLH